MQLFSLPKTVENNLINLHNMHAAPADRICVVKEENLA